jgi:hypothetical protein
MSVPEIPWRCWCKLQDAVDRRLIRWRSRARPARRLLADSDEAHFTNPEVVGQHIQAERAGAELAEVALWKPALLAQADRALAHRLTLFDLEDWALGDTIDWNREYKAGKNAPLIPASLIDYRDHEEVGDCKFVWELNRHQHLVVLARAYRLSGDVRYAEAVLEQLEDWIRQCPYGLGMNWRSPLELAVRLINWVWAAGLIDGSPPLTAERRERLAVVAHQHIHEITRKYSRFSSANNHLIGEAAGVFIACSFFNGLKQASRWREQAREILLREILRQTHEDGGTREQATGYHLFVLEFFLLAGLVARNTGETLSAAYWKRLEEMFDFTANLSEGGKTMPSIGDGDDGYVLDLGGRADPVKELLCVGAALFNRTDFAARSGGFRETAHWLLGPGGHARFDALGTVDSPPVIRSKALPETGLYLLQRGHAGAPDRVSVVFDCGDLGYLSIAAHGHADALSLVLRVAGVDVLVDPGTYDYFTYPAWRRYFRSTRAHNTLVVDDADQSVMLGSFMWGSKARCRGVHWQPGKQGGSVSAEHDGYTRLSDPVIHRRTITLPEDATELTVVDELQAVGRHDVAMHWHFAPSCRLTRLSDHRVGADFEGGRLTLQMDRALHVSLVSGCEDSLLGWVSTGYHRKVPGATLVGRGTFEGNTSFSTQMVIEAPARRERVQVPAGSPWSVVRGQAASGHSPFSSGAT